MTANKHNKKLPVLEQIRTFEDEGEWDGALDFIEKMQDSRNDLNETEKKKIEKIRKRIEEKKKIFGKVRSVIEKKGVKSYIGDDDFVTMVKNEISMRYHIKNKDLNIEEVFRAVKRANKKTGEVIGYYPSWIPVEIYDSPAEMKAKGKDETGSSYIDGISGAFDGKIRIDSSKLVQGESASKDTLLRLYILVTHEYVHLALYEMTDGRCPQWLNEGIAVYFSQNQSDYYEEILYEAVIKDYIIPLEILEADIKKLGEENMVKLAYSQSYSIVSYLVEKIGWERIRQLLENISLKGAEKALNELSLNYYLLEKDWLRWIKRRLNL